MKKIMVINSGSSSIKIKIFKENFEEILDALLERIYVDGNMKISYDGNVIEKKEDFKDHKKTLSIFFDFLKKKQIIKDFNKELLVVGHRVVMGGTYRDATIVDKKVLNNIEILASLAPLHQPANILGIKQIQKLVNRPNVIVCDTSFHQTLEEKKFLYPLPYEFYKKYMVRRFGFHGTSYKFIVQKFIKEEKKQKPNLIIFHLGNGASVAAIKNGKSINTSMGLTPLEGLMMGTRSGDIDPAITFYLAKQLNISFNEVENILNKKSGLLGLSGVSSDMRIVYEEVKKGNKKANMAFEIYIDKIVKYYSQYLNDLQEKIDGIIFTGGIGLNAKEVVKRVIKNIYISNLKLKSNWEKKEWQKISTEKSEIDIFIAKTNEELEIAKQSLLAIRKIN